MIFILHGENLSRSRNAILGLQEKLDMPLKIEVLISDISPGALLDACSSFDIFGQPPFVVLDITMAGRMNLTEYVSVLENISSKAVLVILSAKKLPKTNAFIKNTSKLSAKVILSDARQESNVFAFIDCVFCGRRDQGYKELQKLILDGEDPFKLFSMLLYSLRNVAFVQFGAPNYAKLSPFVKSKAERQAQRFSETTLLGLFEEFYKMDREAKTGKLSTELLVPLAVERVLSICSNKRLSRTNI